MFGESVGPTPTPLPKALQFGFLLQYNATQPMHPKALSWDICVPDVWHRCLCPSLVSMGLWCVRVFVLLECVYVFCAFMFVVTSCGDNVCLIFASSMFICHVTVHCVFVSE